jgi:hypothetical protein
MPISWNEIRHNAIAFAREWAGAKSEIAGRQKFWSDFFAVFGIRRRVLAVFQTATLSLRDVHDRIAFFWFGMLLVENRVQGEDLDGVTSQARRCIADLAIAARHDDMPRYVIASDVARISLLDLKPDDPKKKAVEGGCRIEFPLGSFHRHIHDFAFVLGRQQQNVKEQYPPNLDAGWSQGAAEALETLIGKEERQKSHSPATAATQLFLFGFCLFFLLYFESTTLTASLNSVVCISRII